MLQVVIKQEIVLPSDINNFMIQWTRLQTGSGFQAQWPVTFHTDNVFPFATMNAEPAAYCSLAYETKSNINIYYYVLK